MDATMLSSVPKCVSALLFEQSEDAAAYAPYSLGGSGFLAKFQERYYFVVAGHSLKGTLQNDLRIPIAPNTVDTLPFVNVGRAKFDDHEDDTDYGDFAFLSLPRDFKPASVPDALVAADIPEISTLELLKPDVVLTIRGFPYAAPETKIDPECEKIITQALECNARLVGEKESRFCYKFEYTETRDKSDVEGMSGSPVFMKNPNSESDCFVLVGVVNRETRFISIEVIKNAIQKFEQTPEKTPKIN
jgi:hypothetical protein